MKTLDLQRLLQRQHDEFQKVIFTNTELANLTGSSPKSLSASLRRMVDQGVLKRYASARYGLPGVVTPEDLVSSLDSSAYLTGLYALYQHKLVTQQPSEMVCFSLRRHNRSRVRQTPFGRLVFVCIESSAYDMPKESLVAPPEQALCDYILLCKKRRVPVTGMVTYRNLDLLNMTVLESTMARYSRTVSHGVGNVLNKHIHVAK